MNLTLNNVHIIYTNSKVLDTWDAQQFAVLIHVYEPFNVNITGLKQKIHVWVETRQKTKNREK
jgi:tRNA (Thr-GGU) A37 N-methylase